MSERWLVRRVMRPEEIAIIASHAEMTPAQFVMACGRETDVGYVEAPSKGEAILAAYAQFKIPVGEMRILESRSVLGPTTEGNGDG